MATALPTNPDLECYMCLKNCKTRKILSCGHSFCRDCLVRHIDDKKWTFPCPLCKHDVDIQRGDVNKLVTIFIQTSTDSPRTTDISTTQPSTSLKPKHYCPNHSQKEVDYYCQTCNLGLCLKCIFNDHNDHKSLDLELDSTRERVVQNLSKYEQLIKNKIKDLEKSHALLLETSEKLKSFCDEACTKVNEKTEKIIGELKENCVKIQNEIRDNFDENESKLTETRQKVMTQIENIQTDLDESRPTTDKPSLTLIYSLNKLQDLQKLCENMKTDIPPVTYVEWREGGVKVCDILGSTVTKPLYQSSEGSGPISTETKPLYQSGEGSGPISTETKPLYQSSEGSGPISTETKPLYQSSEGSGPISTVFRFNYKDIETEWTRHYSKDKYSSHGMVLSCNIVKTNYDTQFFINIELLSEDNPQVKFCTIEYSLTILNKEKDKNEISQTWTNELRPDNFAGRTIYLPWNKLTEPSEGFIDNEGQFLVRFDILQVLGVKYK